MVVKKTLNSNCKQFKFKRLNAITYKTGYRHVRYNSAVTSYCALLT